jgi:hypothetical protein
MFIAMIASECAPVAKVGGLADVVYGLSRELQIRGCTGPPSTSGFPGPMAKCTAPCGPASSDATNDVWLCRVPDIGIDHSRARMKPLGCQVIIADATKLQTPRFF